MRFHGELEDLEKAVTIGARWGYGNVMHELMVAWAAELVRKYGMPITSAIRGAAVGRPSVSEVEERLRRLDPPTEGREE